MGGVIARALLVSQEWRHEKLDNRVKQLTLIASPHNGSVLAEAGKDLPFVGSVQLEELSPKSSFLIELNDQWDHWRKKYVPSDCHVGSLYGTEDNIVDPVNARGADAMAVPILGRGHSDIVEVKSKEDEVVTTIVRFFREAGLEDRVTSDP